MNINEIKQYAKNENVPIIKDESITYIVNYIRDNNIKSILEIGSAIGYSAIEMALVNDDIKVTTIEKDINRYNIAVENVKKSNLDNRINIILGDALETKITGTYDLIFIDAAKAQYTKFFMKYCNLLSENGVIITDNLKFHGLVDNPELTNNRNTKQLVRKIKEFTNWLIENNEFKTEFLDIGDGLAISKRNENNKDI